MCICHFINVKGEALHMVMLCQRAYSTVQDMGKKILTISSCCLEWNDGVKTSFHFVQWPYAMFIIKY